jgi:hypothetical protein
MNRQKKKNIMKIEVENYPALDKTRLFYQRRKNIRSIVLDIAPPPYSDVVDVQPQGVTTDVPLVGFIPDNASSPAIVCSSLR